MGRHRVDWDEEERQSVTAKVIEQYLTDPELSVTQIFANAQAHLPPNRRRAITAFASAKDIHAALVEHLALVRGQKSTVLPSVSGNSDRLELSRLQEELD